MPNKDILKILDIARLAPTAGNQQPWKFLVVKDKEKITQMKDECIKDMLNFFIKRKNPSKDKIEQRKQKLTENMVKYFSAQVYIVVLTNESAKYPEYNLQDGALAASYLCLAAHALGYGTVYITDAIPDAITKQVLNIPEEYKRVCITPVGVPAEWPETPKKKTIDEVVTFESV